MGETVLDAGPNHGDLHVYAHCLRDRPGGVALVAINLSRTAPARIAMPAAAQRYTLTADVLEGRSVKLNGRTLALTGAEQLPALSGAPTRRGALTLAPVSIDFLAVPQAGNPACL